MCVGWAQQLRKLVTAMTCAIVPVCNAFFILMVVTAIYSILGVHYFGDSQPQYFHNFASAMFTMSVHTSARSHAREHTHTHTHTSQETHWLDGSGFRVQGLGFSLDA